MTLTSLRLLAHFINTYHPQGRFSDFGGTDTIGASIVKKMLELDEVSVFEKTPTGNFNIIVNGVPTKRKIQYIVLDYDSGIDLMKPIKGKKFDGGICMDLLEHTLNPFTVAKNISNSLKKDALLFVTVPMIWEEHDYPIDGWRFMPKGLEILFSEEMEKITVEIIRDYSPEEEVPRKRLVGVFKKK